MLAAIWAQDETGLIGNNGTLPWYLPNDLAFFKNTTENNTIVMGRTTFEGMDRRVLPNRHTIVLTSDLNYEVPAGVSLMHSVAEVVEYSEKFEGITFITGGANVFLNLLPYCTVIYRTVIHHTFSGDTWMPNLDTEKWTMINISEGLVDDKNKYKHSFETYQKK